MHRPKGEGGTITQAEFVPIAQQKCIAFANWKFIPMVAVLISPIGAIGRDVFRVHENTLITILGVGDRVYLQVLVRDSEIGHNDVAEEISGVNGLGDPVHSPCLVVSSY